MKAKLHKMLARMKNQGMSTAFDAWASCVEEQAAHREKVAKCLGRLRNRDMVGAFDAWHEYVVSKLEHRQKVAQCLGKIMNRGLSQAFTQWSTEVAEGTAACKATHLLQNEVKIQRRFARSTAVIELFAILQYLKCITQKQ